MLLVEKMLAKGNKKLAYSLLRKQYEQGTWQRAPIACQIDRLITIAQLSQELGQKTKCSIPYIDEALILVQHLGDEARGAYEAKLCGLRTDELGERYTSTIERT